MAFLLSNIMSLWVRKMPSEVLNGMGQSNHSRIKYKYISTGVDKRYVV